MTIADVDKPETSEEAPDSPGLMQPSVPPPPAPLPTRKPHEAADEVIVIKRAHLNYAAIAVVFLLVGIVMGALLVGAGSGVTLNMVSTSVAAAFEDRGIGGAPTEEGPIAVSLDDDPSWGPKDAPVTIVEFSDFQCPFCERFFQETLPQIKQTYGDKIHFVYRDFPLPAQIHPQAYEAALAADCANEQGKYWQYHDLLFNHQDKLQEADLVSQAGTLGMNTDQFSQCVKSQKYAAEIQHDLQDGDNYGVTGTPTFFINGRRLVGAQAFVSFQKIIDDELAKKALSEDVTPEPPSG